MTPIRGLISFGMVLALTACAGDGSEERDSRHDTVDRRDIDVGNIGGAADH